jgi:hypothetical protein
LFPRIDGHPARIEDARVVAERAHRPTLAIKSQKRAIAVAIGADCTGDEEMHGEDPFPALSEVRF